jgi:KaiC/GvpD/RAD55 family RecA-like ATPase
VSAAIHARKSADQNIADEEKSVTRQVEHTKAYATRKGWTVADEHVYSDDGISGAEFLKRSGFRRLMNSLKPRPPFQVLVMSEESRFGRGLHYLAEGARRGERSLMLSLDEPVAQVLRNARSIGIELQPAIDRGLTRIVYDAPQEIEIDRHFATIEDIVREFRPQRAVIDSLSTYGSSLGPSGRVFRDFFHAIVALMKEHRVTTVYKHENPELLGVASVMGDYGVSSLVDNIILMNFIELGDTFRHALTVTKTRGSPIRRTTHEVEIENGIGMRVLPRAVETVRAVVPFAAYSGLISRAPERREVRARGTATDTP